jgi:hypothetical protein
MTQPADTTGQSAGAGGQSATGTEGTATGTGTTTATGQSTGTEATATAPAMVTQAEFDALKRQLQAADQNKAKAEAEAKALKDAQLSADEKVKQDLKEAQETLAKREADLRAAQIQNAFVTDNTYQWHDPKAALKLADLTGVTIEGETVKGLKEALKAVADAFPFMVKPKEETAGATDTTTAGSTGVTGQGSAASRTGATNLEDLKKRFPAMRGRVS